MALWQQQYQHNLTVYRDRLTSLKTEADLQRNEHSQATMTVLIWGRHI